MINNYIYIYKGYESKIVKIYSNFSIVEKMDFGKNFMNPSSLFCTNHWMGMQLIFKFVVPNMW